jgi:cytochrome c peroxidase
VRRRFLACLLCNFATWFVFASCLHAQTESAKIELGRALFSDTTLSADGTKSCASCHVPATSFAENRQTSVGVFNRLGSRNAPSLLNAGSAKTFFWDGRRSTLEEAVTDPFFTSFEMGLNTTGELFSKLAKHGLDARFKAVYGPENKLDEAEVRDALASYVRSLSQMKFSSSGDAASNRDAIGRGRRVFFGSGRCNECHHAEDGARYTDNTYHPSALGMQDIAASLPALTTQAMSIPKNPRAIANALGQTPHLAELGRFLVTRDPVDLNTFRTPSLFHVTATAPYMHNGAVPTLEKAVDMEVYYRGLATGEPLQITAAEKADLIAFLRSL